MNNLQNFWLQRPIAWDHIVKAKFDDPVNYANLSHKLQKREGILYTPSPTNDPLEVRAAQRGRVTKIHTYEPGYGLYIVITHDWGTETFVTYSPRLKAGASAVNNDACQGRSYSSLAVCIDAPMR